MRVAYLTGRYPAVSHTFILREVQALRRRGVSVETLSIWRTADEDLLSDADRSERDATYSVLPVKPLRFLRAHRRALADSPRGYLSTFMESLRLSPPGLRAKLWHAFYFAEAMVLWERCRDLGIEHLHAHFTGNASMAALLIAQLERRRRPLSWSMTVHGPIEFYAVDTSRLEAKVKRADLVMCISDFARSQVMANVDSDQWKKTRIVHCGIEPGSFSPPRSRDRDGASLRVLTVGRLVPFKAQAVLLEALGELTRRGVKLSATVVGEGPTRPTLEATAEELGIAESVTFAGAVGQHEIHRYYSEADVFCLPSFAEGLPVVLMEAMAMNLPVVATRIMGVAELVEDGVTGFLVPPGRSELLADAIERMAGDQGLRERMGQAGRDRVLADFDVDGAAERLERLFAETVAARAS